jgi:hypothetical protein
MQFWWFVSCALLLLANVCQAWPAVASEDEDAFYDAMASFDDEPILFPAVDERMEAHIFMAQVSDDLVLPFLGVSSDFHDLSRWLTELVSVVDPSVVVTASDATRTRGERSVAILDVDGRSLKRSFRTDVLVSAEVMDVLSGLRGSEYLLFMHSYSLLKMRPKTVSLGDVDAVMADIVVNQSPKITAVIDPNWVMAANREVISEPERVSESESAPRQVFEFELVSEL